MKWLHVIGISGKATANIAKMFKEFGWFVTGSDNQFLPPASIIVEKNNIPFVKEFHYSHMQKTFWEEKLNKKLNISQVPDLTLMVESLSSKNKEYLFAKNKKLDVRPYSKILSEYLIKENSIVVAGTAGKTTTTSIITKILKDLNFNPSYMIGAEVIDFNESIQKNNSNWSVIEGDEYHNKIISDGPKFLEYKPKFLVLTNIGYEHQDIFNTKEEYVNAFRKLVSKVPQDGFIVARNNDSNISETLKSAKANVFKYEVVKNFDQVKAGVWSLLVGEKKNAIFNNKKNKILEFKTDLLGDLVLEDILAAVIVVLNLPKNLIPSDLNMIDYVSSVKDSIEDFKGVKKRLEIIYQDKKTVVIDDFGVTPNRAKNSLSIIKSEFPNHKIIAIFEPNSASRFKDLKEFNENYNSVFLNVNELIIPDLSSFNKDLLNASDFVKRLIGMNINAKHIPSKNIQKAIKEKIKYDNIIVVFFSTYKLDSISRQLRNI